jgi:hypothetical protein
LNWHRLDCLASHGDLSNWEFCKQKLAELEPEEIRPRRLLTGDDLIELGYSRARSLLNLDDRGGRTTRGKNQNKEEAFGLSKRVSAYIIRISTWR